MRIVQVVGSFGKTTARSETGEYGLIFSLDCIFIGDKYLNAGDISMAMARIANPINQVYCLLLTPLQLVLGQRLPHWTGFLRR